MAKRRKRGHAADIEDFPSFIRALGLKPYAVRDGGSAAADGEAAEGLLLFTDSDRPAAVALWPRGASAMEEPPVGRVRAALALLMGNGHRPRETASGDVETGGEFRDYLPFADEAGGGLCFLLDPRLEGILLARLEEKGSREFAEALLAAIASLPAIASSEGDPAPFAPIMKMEDPVSAHAGRFLFPAAFRSGETRFRFEILSFGVLEGLKGGDGEEAGRELWFRFGFRSPALSLGGFWVFSRGEGTPGERFPALAAATARLAASALAEGFRRAGLEVSTAVAAVPRPVFGARGAWVLEGSLSAGYVRFGVRAVVQDGYLPAILSELRRASPSAAAPETAEPVVAFLALGRLLRGRMEAVVLDELVEEYRGEGKGAADPASRIVPFHAAYGLLPDDDRRRLAQNFLVRELPAARLPELFYYRKTVTDGGSGKRVAVKPQAFDPASFAACLPRQVAETFIASVREGVSSKTAEAFVLINEQVYRDLAGELRHGSLALNPLSERLLADIHLRYVYPRARRRLDAMVDQDRPLAALRALPPRIFRAVVDRSDATGLAPAFIGREAAIEEISRWCSKRKTAYIREEARRLGLLLSRGEADCDELCLKREALADLSREIIDKEREEREAVHRPSP